MEQAVEILRCLDDDGADRAFLALDDHHHLAMVLAFWGGRRAETAVTYELLIDGMMSRHVAEEMGRMALRDGIEDAAPLQETRTVLSGHPNEGVT